MNARSIAYFTSADVTARLTGGENMIPGRILTVTVLPSSAMSGMSVARSGTGREMSRGS